jgi:hypothetical protein
MAHETLDDQLKSYFDQHKKEIKNKGFTEEVMRKLPRKERSNYIIYMFALVAVLIVVLVNLQTNLMPGLNEVVLSLAQFRWNFGSAAMLLGVLLVVLSVSLIAVDKEDNILSM